ncbi:MAG TPA: SDR family oxidoreductase [Candidatus Dormibacteraeota bacterium]|nr:SDR family oxidoreductase [Candidatus Dormibacteraeota bacterium]
MDLSSFSLADRTAVVLGGTSGLGHTLALGLADAGADVVVSARRQALIDATASEIEAKGRKTLRVLADVRNKESLVRLRDAVLAAFGKVDILVNAAGTTRKLPTLEMTDDDWNAILDTNLTGTLRGCQVFGEPMLKRGYGRVINIASLATERGLYQVAAYSASKAGVGSLTKSLAVEWSRHGVLVNAIVPGVFRTDLNAALLDGTARGREFLMRTPMGRYGKAEELVGAAVFLASDACAFVTGELLVVDGGFLASGVNQ